MPEQQEQFQNAVFQVLEAVMFATGRRFYFITEKPAAPAGPDGEAPLFLAVPEKGMERIKELYPHLLPLAEDMNGREVDFETSRRAVCTFVLDNLDGKSLPKDMTSTIFESATFQVQMQLFNAWVQMHENQLDQGFLEFGAWRKLFTQWRETPGAKELANRLAMSGQGAAAQGKDTIH